MIGYRENYRLVDALYRHLLGRPADPSGLETYSRAIASPPTADRLIEVIRIIDGSEEAQNYKARQQRS